MKTIIVSFIVCVTTYIPAIRPTYLTHPERDSCLHEACYLSCRKCSRLGSSCVWPVCPTMDAACVAAMRLCDQNQKNVSLPSPPSLTLPTHPLNKHFLPRIFLHVRGIHNNLAAPEPLFQTTGMTAPSHNSALENYLVVFCRNARNAPSFSAASCRVQKKKKK